MTKIKSEGHEGPCLVFYYATRSAKAVLEFLRITILVPTIKCYDVVYATSLATCRLASMSKKRNIKDESKWNLKVNLHMLFCPVITDYKSRQPEDQKILN